MGIKMIVEVMDHAPSELSAAERLVLVVIAEDVRDGDSQRMTWPSFNASVLARRTGLTGKGSLKDALQRLARRGLEVRIPISVGKDGRPLYAVPGRQCRYRLPVFEGEGNTSPSTEEGEGRTSAGEGTPSPKGRSQPRQARAEPPPTPLPSVPPLSSPPPPAVTVPPHAAPVREVEREIPAAPPQDPAATVATAWATTRGGRRNPTAEQAVTLSARQLLDAEWPLTDVTALAVDMARRQPTYRDLTRHADHWQPRVPGQRAGGTVPEPGVAALRDVQARETARAAGELAPTGEIEAYARLRAQMRARKG